MPRMRGTLLNTATVTVGALIGGTIGTSIPESYKEVALHGIGLVCIGIGISMFLRAKNPLIAAASVAFGGILGLWLGIDAGIGSLAEWSKEHLGGKGTSTFSEGMVSSFVLFCVGPMTLLGCLQDGLEAKIDLLAVKSTMDGISAVFLAATSGRGVLVTAALLFLLQGALTLLARFLAPLARNEAALAELSAAGGAILIGTGFGLLDIANLHTANYLPAIFIAPGLAILARWIPQRFGARKPAEVVS